MKKLIPLGLLALAACAETSGASVSRSAMAVEAAKIPGVSIQKIGGRTVIIGQPVN